MKTEFKVKHDGPAIVKMAWSTDIQSIRDNFRKPGAQLWRRQSETQEEACVRRWTAFRNWFGDGNDGPRMTPGVSVEGFADKLAPPPAVTEVQVDWDTLEPIHEVPLWQAKLGFWVAGQTEMTWSELSDVASYQDMVYGRVAIGATREAALRNLAEMQEARK